MEKQPNGAPAIETTLIQPEKPVMPEILKDLRLKFAAEQMDLWEKQVTEAISKGYTKEDAYRLAGPWPKNRKGLDEYRGAQKEYTRQLNDYESGAYASIVPGQESSMIAYPTKIKS
jgi:hypothetical protein